jgi:hypothetical protein
MPREIIDNPVSNGTKIFIALAEADPEYLELKGLQSLPTIAFAPNMIDRPMVGLDPNEPVQSDPGRPSRIDQTLQISISKDLTTGEPDDEGLALLLNTEVNTSLLLQVRTPIKDGRIHTETYDGVKLIGKVKRGDIADNGGNFYNAPLSFQRDSVEAIEPAA